MSALADMTSEEAKDPTASIHFTYLTNDTDTIITEEQLQVVFSQFGDVVDIIIKRYEIDQVMLVIDVHPFCLTQRSG